MDRMSSLWSVVFVLGLAWSGCSALQVDDASNSVSLSSEPPPLRKNRPNIVLVLVDDLGWNDVRCFGHGYHDTPNIDRLGAEGIRFTDAYANAPNCAPSRACLMTGQYTPRHGVYTVNSSARGKSKNRKLIPIPNTKRLDPEAQTMAEVLSAAGYRCGHFGKWHLGDDPLDQGFHVNAGGFAAGHPKSYFSPYQNPSLSDGPKGEHLTRRLTDETVGFIEEAVAVDKPFFAYVSLYAVHTPIQAAPEQSEPYRDRIKALADGKGRIGARAKYAAMVAAVDASVGRIRGAIERLGIANDTLIVFFSDNGGNGGITSMDPLRGAKGMLYEGGGAGSDDLSLADARHTLDERRRGDGDGSASDVRIARWRRHAVGGRGRHRPLPCDSWSSGSGATRVLALSSLPGGRPSCGVAVADDSRERRP